MRYKRFFTSDPHYYHSKVLSYCDRDVSTIEDMHHTLIINWNNKVSDNDEVYVVGDFSFAGSKKTEEILKQLKGRKYLIAGNHDYGKTNFLKRHGFLVVCHEMIIHMRDRLFKICHYPYAESISEDDRYIDLRPVKQNGIWLLCGHVHNEFKVDERNKVINVGVDQWGLDLASEDDIFQIVNKVENRELFNDLHR